MTARLSYPDRLRNLARNLERTGSSLAGESALLEESAARIDDLELGLAGAANLLLRLTEGHAGRLRFLESARAEIRATLYRPHGGPPR
jgi:hypothetical protein